jgi:HemY protein
VTSDHWEPISPVDGRLDAFQWRVPVETRDDGAREILASKIDELIAIAPATVEAKAVEPVAKPEVKAEAAPKVEERLVPAEIKASEPEIVTAEPVTMPVRPSVIVSEDDGPKVTVNIVNVVNGVASPAAGRNGDPVSSRAIDAGTPATSVTPLPQDRAPVAKSDPNVFIAPRAPDDPGIDPPEPKLEQPVARRTYRSVN